MNTNRRFSSHAAMLAVMAFCAAPALAAQSSAYAVSANLSTDGNSHVQLAAQLPTSGATALGQSYDKPLNAILLSKAVRLLPSQLRGPMLTAVEQKVATDAAGSNGVDTLNTSGTSSAAAGVVALTLYPPLPILPPVPVPGPVSAITDDASVASITALPPLGHSVLNVQFSKLKASATYDQIFPGPARRNGSTSFAKLTLSGPLVGSKALSFSGDVQPNTVVVNTPTVKITLNAQTIPQQPVCQPNVICPLYRALETVETKAVLIELTNALVLGHQVSGEIVIGDAEAGQ